MEFWGVEVKAGEPLKVEPEDGMVLHLSQACLGETKSKGNESILLSVKVGDQKFVLGNLSVDKFPQLSFDLVFEKEFELSHNWKNGSIHLCGYQTLVGEHTGDDEDFDDFDDSEEEDDVIPSNAGVQNGKVAQKVEEAKASVGKGVAAKAEPSEKPKVKVVEPSKGDEDEDSEDDSSDDEDDSEDGSDEDMLVGDDSDEDESDDESDKETPKKPESSKKRANDSAAKTPVSTKKAKIASPKSDGKKVGGHTATPHPAKKAGKAAPATPATDKSKAQTPKTGGSISCKSCSKSFGSDKALESHTKAKHG